MADGALQLQIATPERQMVDMEVREVEVPCLDGLIGVLPGHAPLISILRPGVLVYRADHETRVLAIYGGFVEVLNDRVKVLADDAERKEDINVREAQEQPRRRAPSWLRKASKPIQPSRCTKRKEPKPD